MSEEEPTTRDIYQAQRATGLERHAQSIVAVVVMGLISWVALTVQSLQVTAVETKVKVQAIEMKMDNVYTKEQAMSDFGLRDERIRANRARIEAVAGECRPDYGAEQ